MPFLKDTFMKTSILMVLAALIVTPATSFAARKCQGEAQIIATGSSSGKGTMTHCLVNIYPNSVEIYNSSVVCPLDINYVLATGILVARENGHDCPVTGGAEVRGVLVREGKSVRLEEHSSF